MRLELRFMFTPRGNYVTPKLGRFKRRLARRVALGAAVLVVALAPSDAGAQGLPGASPAAKVRDNLFLLEEAYNQEAGVVQHIQNYQRSRDGWAYTFTEEWPVPRERHQLSMTLPVVRPSSSSGGHFGDALVNYRFQLLSGEGRVAMAPRLSLVLPTGDERSGAGRGGLGFQTNLPVSLDLHPNWVVHLNAGLTMTTRARLDADSGRRGTVDTIAGLAVVWLPTHSLNGVLEVLHQSVVETTANGGTTRRASVVVNPGLRAALDFKSGLQVVPGLSFPIEWHGGERHVSLLFYLSFEHPLWKPSASSGSAEKD
jgi:hypothetical protein